jgi:hypothetical protein
MGGTRALIGALVCGSGNNIVIALIETINPQIISGRFGVSDFQRKVFGCGSIPKLKVRESGDLNRADIKITVF